MINILTSGVKFWQGQFYFIVLFYHVQSSFAKSATMEVIPSKGPGSGDRALLDVIMNNNAVFGRTLELKIGLAKVKAQGDTS